MQILANSTVWWYTVYVVYKLFAAITGCMVVFLMVLRHSKALCSLPVALADEHLAFVVVA